MFQYIPLLVAARNRTGIDSSNCTMPFPNGSLRMEAMPPPSSACYDKGPSLKAARLP